MKLISWNVNGFRAIKKKGFDAFVEANNPDILCLQESKMQEGQADVQIEGYFHYMNCAEKKGYSGTILYTKKEPKKVAYGIGELQHDREGRVITAEYETFYLVCVYTPNAGEGLKRLEYRNEWDIAFRSYVNTLSNQKAVFITGDLNVANEEIDIKNPKTNHKNAGFTDLERDNFKQLLATGFIDSFRHLYPDKVMYSWWSYRFKSREKNAGWRIDYWLISIKAQQCIVDASILTDVMGSDHCPVQLNVNIEW